MFNLTKEIKDFKKAIYNNRIFDINFQESDNSDIILNTDEF